MVKHDWAEVLIDAAVLPDGSVRDIELPCLVPPYLGAPLTPALRDVHSDFMAAVRSGRLVALDVELRHVPGGHLVWRGPASNADIAWRRCPVCGVVPSSEELLLLERFSIPRGVVGAVLARRRDAHA